jgi:hypothetical protein
MDNYPRPTNVTLPNSSDITTKKALQFHLAICHQIFNFKKTLNAFASAQKIGGCESIVTTK